MAGNYKVMVGDSTLRLSEKFYGNLKKTIRVEKNTDGSTFNKEWVDQIEAAVPYINNIFDNPKRFIISQEEILAIEKSKKVTVETIKHLSKHSNFISDYDEETDDIKPSKLLNELKEETFNTYENRFIYTLVDIMDSFIRRMEEKLKQLEYSKNNLFESHSESEVSGENIKCVVKMESVKKIDSIEKDEDFNFRVDAIKSSINGWRQTDVYISLKKEKVAKVTNPLNRTNVLLKNPNFKIAASLWDYLHSFREEEESIDKNPDVLTNLPPNLQSIVDNSILMYYLILKISSTNNKTLLENYNKYTKQAILNMVKDTTAVLADSDDAITQEDLNKSIAEGNAEAAIYKKGLDVSLVEGKIKDTIRNYIDRVEGSYYLLAGGENNEK